MAIADRRVVSKLLEERFGGGVGLEGRVSGWGSWGMSCVGVRWRLALARAGRRTGPRRGSGVVGWRLQLGMGEEEEEEHPLTFSAMRGRVDGG